MREAKRSKEWAGEREERWEGRREKRKEGRVAVGNYLLRPVQGSDGAKKSLRNN
jgi:hypothetical protein